MLGYEVTSNLALTRMGGDLEKQKLTEPTQMDEQGFNDDDE